MSTICVCTIPDSSSTASSISASSPASSSKIFINGLVMSTEIRNLAYLPKHSPEAILGSILIVLGLYAILWAKAYENRRKSLEIMQSDKAGGSETTMENAVLGRTLFFAGLEYTSTTFASAMANIIPSFTFILAVVFRYQHTLNRKQTVCCGYRSSILQIHIL
ncbi:hypothetical protein CUMW_002980 [Citrus unshiu]|nr:hypothetical protein CUMW_002980 [Citrus unshiu]